MQPESLASTCFESNTQKPKLHSHSSRLSESIAPQLIKIMKISIRNMFRQKHLCFTLVAASRPRDTRILMKFNITLPASTQHQQFSSGALLWHKSARSLLIWGVIFTACVVVSFFLHIIDAEHPQSCILRLLSAA
jgi:hypothetical protein